jgi:hypothetical protein
LTTDYTDSKGLIVFRSAPLRPGDLALNCCFRFPLSAFSQPHPRHPRDPRSIPNAESLTTKYAKYAKRDLNNKGTEKRIRVTNPG